jgi:hypothetical protein
MTPRRARGGFGMEAEIYRRRAAKITRNLAAARTLHIVQFMVTFRLKSGSNLHE